MITRSLFLAISVLMLASSSLAAQSLTCTLGSGEASRICTRPSLVLLNVPVTSSVAAPSTNYSLAPAGGTVPGSAYELGYFVPALPLSLTLRTNAPVNLYLRATGSTFTGSSSICTSKPISAASVSTSANGTFSSLSSTAPGPLVHAQTTATGGETVHIQFRIALSWSADRPNSSACGLPLQLTLRTN
jgi:hypothetical protein